MGKTPIHGPHLAHVRAMVKTPCFPPNYEPGDEDFVDFAGYVPHLLARGIAASTS